ncbi:slowpoke binding protein [Culex quinquefasciatus]|uniref:Slowpoke binding protein n=1 Tax=Culex quinquefasciatus TaxID=7176 RepID=B0WCH3_CULQU|nr:slowpoke binding protein [Culex quinquefasciatus]|eukprot:XP_001846407.1 slowpoke binding protein [Culex quinquefasciatus]
MRRAQSAAEFNDARTELPAPSAASKRMLFRGRSVSSDHDQNSESEHTERSPLVSAKLDSLAKLLFSRSLMAEGSGGLIGGGGGSGSGGTSTKDNDSPTRHNVRYQYTALDSGIGAPDRSPRERAARDRAFTACQDWLQHTGGRYESIAHLDDIGSRPSKHWFLLNDCTRGSSLADSVCSGVAHSGHLRGNAIKQQPFKRKTDHKPPTLSTCRHNVRYQYTALDSGIGAPDRSPRERAARDRAFTACQDWLQHTGGRYESIAHLDDIGSRPSKHWFLLNDCTAGWERGIPSHGHLHSGNVILQNGVARLSGLENGLLGLNSRVNAIVWSRSAPDIDNIDVVCFGHLLFEMCAGYELTSPQPTPGHYQLDLERYPQVVDVLQMIFESPDGRYPTVEELVLCDIFRNIDLRELRGTCVPVRVILDCWGLQKQTPEIMVECVGGDAWLGKKLSGLENGLLGLNSRVNAIVWSRSAPDIDNIDVVCFGHLLFEMCAGYELTSPQPTPGHYQLDLERYPQVVDVLQMIFESPDGRYPTVEELVLCDIFRNIDLRELRGTCVPSFKHGLSSSTLSLLNAVRRRQGAILSGSYSEGSSPCTPPSTPRERKTGCVIPV